MSLPAQQIAARYRLQLSDTWQDWFDHLAYCPPLAGSFRAPLAVPQLLDTAPSEIWPGLMLPDTLPLVSNEYGDWICIRVVANGSFGELVHWYHGGGDWIPVGTSMAEMAIHDVVDQFRPVGRQMLRSAPETTGPLQHERVLADFTKPELQQWLCDRLPLDGSSCGATAATSISERLDELARMLSQREYEAALLLLRQCRWTEDAVACDMIQYALQQSSDEGWRQAKEVAVEVLARRNDLGWATNIVGLCQKQSGNLQSAADTFFSGRNTSAFSDQAVRMRTHWDEPKYGKFTIGQIFALSEFLSADQRADGYLMAINQAPAKLTRQAVQEYWINEARRQLDERSPAAAYDCYYRAGWDLGVQRLSECLPILEGLVHCAQAAGWEARAAVAQTHLDCLRRRIG